jgi:hypothetical protein
MGFAVNSVGREIIVFPILGWMILLDLKSE